MVRINLLPWREEERVRRLTEFLFMLGVGLVVALIISFYLHMYVDGLVTQQNKRNGFLESAIKVLDKDIAAINDLEKRKRSLLERMSIIQKLQESRPEIVHLFDNLVGTTPDGIYLTKMTQRGRGLVIEGMAQSNARVSAYMRQIDASDWLGGAVLNVVQKGGQTISKNQGARSYRKFVLKAAQVDKRKKKEK